MDGRYQLFCLAQIIQPHKKQAIGEEFRRILAQEVGCFQGQTRLTTSAWPRNRD
jgi:hypothetical protein